MKLTKLLFILLTILLILSFIACGGDGGDASDVPVVDGPWLCFTAQSPYSAVSAGQISWELSHPMPVLEYSIDGVNWKPFVVDDTSVFLNKTGDRVYVRAKSTNDAFSFYDSSVYPEVYRIICFRLGGNIAASGNIMSLLDRDCKSKIIPCDGCFSHLFYLCDNLTTAPELPATTLTERCYNRMFEGCTSLKTAPELPATTLANMCYSNMFTNCASLITAPELPATALTNMCYFEMFNNCSALMTAPELPAAILGKSCYQKMFRECVSLKTAPELPATTLAESCYAGMFVDCTSLTTAPGLPATTLKEKCYSNMFAYCASLTTAPELPATTLAESCYAGMFYGCASLNYIKVHFKDWMNSAIEWMKGVPSGGAFHCRIGLPISGSGTYFPDGWTVIRDVPEPTP